MKLPHVVSTLVIVFAIAAGSVRPKAPLQDSRQTSLTGHFLVASSGIGDPRFSRAVILLVEHGPDGALGLVVNIPARQMLLADLLQMAELPAPRQDASVRVHYGGPVALEKAFVLHSPEVRTPSTRTVLEGVVLSTDAEMFRLLGSGKGPARFRILLGYSGWGPGQLEQELRVGAWLTIQAPGARIFEVEPSELWAELMKGHRM